MNYLFFDTETSGFLPHGRLVSIAWQLWNNDKFIEKQSYIIRPDDFYIPYSAVRIHGITTEYALENGCDILDVLNKFNKIVNYADVLVGHNLSFDIKILLNEFYLYNIPTNLDKKQTIDTMHKSKHYLKLTDRRGRLKPPKLSELHYALFGHFFENAHSADADIEATVKCFFELMQRNIL